MKWSLYMTDDMLQVNLEPETDHEREAVKLLSGHNGPAVIHSGAAIGTNMAGYLRNFGDNDRRALAITIKRERRDD